jgi:predicted protein tyrosine phosphatase
MLRDSRAHRVRSRGTESGARIRVTSNDIRWADVVFVMERWHHNRLRQMFANVMRNKRVICLDIPDNYKYMDSALVEQLTVALSPHIELPAS